MMRLLLVVFLFTAAAVSAVSKHGRRKHYLVEIEDEVGRIYLIGTNTLLLVHNLHLNFRMQYKQLERDTLVGPENQR